MAARKVTRKKSASKAPSDRPAKQTRVVPDALMSGEANDEAIESKDASKVTKKPKVHAKVVSILVSVGTEDRKRSHEKFVEDIKKKLGAVAATDGNGNRNPGLHVTATGGYYILDGKVCRPEDYDAKTGTFKKGAVPPSWAGGPKHNPTLGAATQIQYDLANLTPDEYDKKYHLGKYKVSESLNERLITPQRQKELWERWREERDAKKDEGLEEIDWDWDAEDAKDDVKLSRAADASAKKAIKRLKKSASSQKRVVKKTAKQNPQKKTVKRKK